jgi:transporter family protein
MWALFAVIAAFFLGTYDVFKKVALKENAVIPVLFFSCLSSAMLFLPLVLISEFVPQWINSTSLYVPEIPFEQHRYIFLKSIIVTSSWLFAYFAMKHLPITIVSPIRATAPLWTLVGAIIIYGEKLELLQWIGLAITLVFFYMFSLAGKTEGIHFRRNKWVFFIIAATILGSISSLYDKFLIANFNRLAVQAWFSFYQIVILAPIVLLLWYPNRKKSTPFKWRWAIPLIGIFLVLTDFIYFYALSYEDSLVSVISAIRRSGVIVSFSIGAYMFREHNLKQKGILLLGILLGVFLLIMGSR